MSRAIREPSCHLLAALLVGAIAVFGIHCGSPKDRESGGPDGLPEDFTKNFEAAQAEGIDVYWLGITFAHDGVTYSLTTVVLKPDLYGFGRELRLTYAAESPNGSLLLPISLQSRDDWESWAAQRAAALRGYTEVVIDLPPWDAFVYVKPGLSPDRQQVRLVLEGADTILTALGSPTIDERGRQINPLSHNPDLLVALMEDLRPYPE